MNLTIKSIDDKLNKILNESENLFDSSYNLVNNNKDLIVKVLELEKNLELFISLIPDQFEKKVVYIELNENNVVQIYFKELNSILIDLGVTQLLEIKGLDNISINSLLLVDSVMFLNLEDLIKNKVKIRDALKKIYIISQDPNFEKRLKLLFIRDADIDKIKKRIKKYYDLALIT